MKFDINQLNEIKRLYEVDGKNYTDISKIMNSSPAVISGILRGKTYQGLFKGSRGQGSETIESIPPRNKNEKLSEAKRLFEEEGLNCNQISRKLNIPDNVIRNAISGITYKGFYKVLEYNGNLTKSQHLEMLKDYQEFVPILDILSKYGIDRVKFNAIRQKYKIPNRRHRTPTKSNITLEVDGKLKTYSSIELASKENGFATDFLYKLKRGETYCLGKNANKGVILVHSLDRLEKLERASELVGKIFYQGSITDKKDYGSELKELIYDLGYADELIVETETHNF